MFFLQALRTEISGGPTHLSKSLNIFKTQKLGAATEKIHETLRDVALPSVWGFVTLDDPLLQGVKSCQRSGMDSEVSTAITIATLFGHIPNTLFVSLKEVKLH